MKTTYYQDTYYGGQLVKSEKTKIDITHYDDDAPVPTDEQLDKNLAAYTQENKVHLKGFICCMGLFFIILIVLSIINLVNANWGYKEDVVKKEQAKFNYFITNLESRNIIQFLKKSNQRILSSENDINLNANTKVCPQSFEEVSNLYDINFYGFSKGFFCYKKAINNYVCNDTVDFDRKEDINNTLYTNCYVRNNRTTCTYKPSITPNYCYTIKRWFSDKFDYQYCNCPEKLFKFSEIYNNKDILQNLQCVELNEIKPKKLSIKYFNNICYKKFEISGYAGYSKGCQSGYSKCYGGVCVKGTVCPPLNDFIFLRSDGKPIINLQINRNTFPCHNLITSYYRKYEQIESQYPLSNAPNTLIYTCSDLFDESSQDSMVFNISTIYNEENITHQIWANDLKLPKNYEFFNNYSLNTQTINSEFTYLLNVKQTTSTCNLDLNLFRKVNSQASETVSINIMSIIRIILIIITIFIFFKFVQGSVTTKEKNYKEYIIFGADVNERWYRHKTLFEHLMEIRLLVFMFYLLTLLTLIEWIIYIAKYNKYKDDWKYVENFGRAQCILNSYSSNDVFISIGTQLRQFYGDNKDNIEDLVIALLVGTVVISIFIKTTFSSLRLFLGLKPN